MPAHREELRIFESTASQIRLLRHRFGQPLGAEVVSAHSAGRRRGPAQHQQDSDLRAGSKNYLSQSKPHYFKGFMLT